MIDTRQTAHEYAVERLDELSLTPETVADRVKVNLLNAVFQEIAELEMSTSATMQAFALRLTSHLIPEIQRLSAGLATPEAIEAMVSDWNTQPNFISALAESMAETLGVTHVEIQSESE